MTASDSIAKALGLLVGLSLAVLLLASWRVSGEGGFTGAEMAFTMMPPGELTASPAGVLMRGRGLRPGGRAISGRAKLSNIAGNRLAVRARLAPSNPDLDRALRVELRAGGVELASGALGQLRRWSPRAVIVSPGGATTFDAKAWIPRGHGRAAGGRLVDVTVELRATPRGGPRR